jgi:hypothetical protein
VVNIFKKDVVVSAIFCTEIQKTNKYFWVKKLSKLLNTGYSCFLRDFLFRINTSVLALNHSEIWNGNLIFGSITLKVHKHEIFFF